MKAANHMMRAWSLSHHEVDISLLAAKIIHQPLKTMLLLTHLEHKPMQDAINRATVVALSIAIILLKCKFLTHKFYCSLSFSHRIRYQVSQVSVAALVSDLISLNSSVCLLYHFPFPPCHKSQRTLIFCSEKAFQDHKNNSACKHKQMCPSATTAFAYFHGKNSRHKWRCGTEFSEPVSIQK